MRSVIQFTQGSSEGGGFPNQIESGMGRIDLLCEAEAAIATTSTATCHSQPPGRESSWLCVHSPGPRRIIRMLYRSLSVVALAFFLIPQSPLPAAEPIKVGVIGLDNYQAVAFTQLFHDPKAAGDLAG